MLTTVAIFREPWEAQLFRSRLQAEGLLAFLQYDHRVAIDWMYAFAIGGVHVQVVDDEAPEARAVIARLRAGDFRAELLDMFGDLDDPHCPACGSQDFRRRASAPQIMFSFAILVLTGVPVPPGSWLRTCRRCGKRWEDNAAVSSTS